MMRTAGTALSVVSFLLLFLLAAPGKSDSFAADKKTNRVFILNSYHQGYTFSDNEMRGIDEAFARSGVSIEKYISYMDAKRIPATPQYFRQLKELIAFGYKGIRFDVLITTDNDALEFMRKYRDELFPGVPVVFSGINNFDVRMLDGRKDLTGTVEETDYAGTINIALKLLPATNNIVIVTDNTTTGKAHSSAVDKIRRDFPEAFAKMAATERDLNAAICKKEGVTNGKRWRKRVFLDELPPDAGRYEAEPDIECGVLCIQEAAE